jgi:hypothetical protein
VHTLLAADKVRGKPQGSGLKQGQLADDQNVARKAPV